MNPSELPVFEIRDAFVTALAGPAPVRVLVKAPTGSGKSTMLPQWVMAECATTGMTVVVEPRRMAARLLAAWVARQLGATLGVEVGHAVRFDAKYRKSSRLVFVTDGVFQRWLHEDPELNGIAAVVFDEFHERRLAVDAALGHCLELQEGARPDLKVIVMSATLDTGTLGEFLKPVTVLESGGRTFPVEIKHRVGGDAMPQRRDGVRLEVPLWERMAECCRHALTLPDAGNVLMFLPGTHEIRRTISLLEQAAWARGYEIFPLHSALPQAAQEAALTEGTRPRILVATNVAETSLTIPGVRTVIDSGLARIASHDARRGINTLMIGKISRAAADQRAGRAGRTAPGRCFRLWSEAEHARRRSQEAPEIQRVDLSETALLFAARSASPIEEFRWLDAPPGDALARARRLLRDLGALAGDGTITATGRDMATMPLEPRLARLLLAGISNGCAGEAAFIGAAMQGEGVFAGNGQARDEWRQIGDSSDFAAEWRALCFARDMHFDARRCVDSGVHARSCRDTAEIYKRLGRFLGVDGSLDLAALDFDGRAQAVGKAMLAAFGDHLAVRLGAGTHSCRLTEQRRGKLDERSCAADAMIFVAAEVTEVEGRDLTVHLRRATEIEPEWLREIEGGGYREFAGAAWDPVRRRVVARHETRFHDLVITSSERDQGVDPDAAATLLAEHVIADGLVLKNWNAKVEQWVARLGCLSEWMPELEMPGWSAEDHAAAIAQICDGAVSYKQVKDADVWQVLRQWLSAPQSAALDHFCPERIALANGHSAKISYKSGIDPWISLRVSHLFGIWVTPQIADGRVPLLVQILTTGQKPWQTTKDLAGFWESGYRQMKKEIAGRYPRHPWPDDPKAWHAEQNRPGAEPKQGKPGR